MSITVNLDNINYFIPEYQDTNWAVGLGNLTDYLVAIPSSVVQANGVTPMTGNLTLTNNSNIILQDSEGTPKSVTLAVSSPITTSYTLTLPVDAGSSGQVLSTDGSGTASWINAAGGGTVGSGTTGQLAYYSSNGTTVIGETISGDATIASGGALTISNNAITDAKVSSTAAIALTKLASSTSYYWYAANSSGVLSPLAVTASKAVITDANGLPAASSTTSTELGYVHGVTSAIQTQIGTLLPLSGGTMSGGINMGGNKVSNIPNGTTATDPAAFGQIYTGFQAPVQATTTSAFSTTSSTYQSTNLNASIAPTSSSHRIKVTVGGDVRTDSQAVSGAFLSLKRGSTELSSSGNGFAIANGSATGVLYGNGAFTYIDSPATTSSTTYTVVLRNSDNSTTVRFGQAETMQVIILEEIV